MQVLDKIIYAVTAFNRNETDETCLELRETLRQLHHPAALINHKGNQNGCDVRYAEHTCGVNFK